jgi:DNA repair protein RadA/Sms
MALAVLEKRGKVNLFQKDVFTATVGGMKLTEPAADLAVVLAVASAEREIALPADLVVLGEVGLAGEIRRVNGVGKRLSEALRLGFTKALVPPDAGPLPDGMRVLVAHDLFTALDVLGLNKGK